MPQWKPFAGSWYSKHLIEVTGATLVIAMLAGAVVFALVQTPVRQVVDSRSVKTRENRSAVVPLEAFEEPAPAAPQPQVPSGNQTDSSLRTTVSKPARQLEPPATVPPAPAPASSAGDYSMKCGPPLTTLTAFATAEITCEVRSDSFSGPLNIKVVSLDSVNGSGPLITVSPSNPVLKPGGTASVTIAVDSSNGSAGAYRLGMTVQHGDLYNFSASGDTGKSRTVMVEVTPSSLPPFIPFLPQQPLPPGVDQTASAD